MGRKIFVSYKYADSDVEQINHYDGSFDQQDTARSYVDLLEDYLTEKSDHLYKGESEGEDLSGMSESTIRDKLYERIYDSTLTIVMIFPGMDNGSHQKNQWIPQEISYSLREQSRTNSKGQDIKSSTNAMLAIVLPDRYGNYNYYVYQCSRCSKNCRVHKTGWLFPIMKDNMFNIKKPDSESCDTKGTTIYHGDPSYIVVVRWDDFYGDPEKYIKKAYEIRDRKEEYDIRVQLK